MKFMHIYLLNNYFSFGYIFILDTLPFDVNEKQTNLTEINKSLIYLRQNDESACPTVKMTKH